MRTVGIGVLSLGILVGLWGQTPSQAAPASIGSLTVGAALVGHPPGPPGHAWYWHHPPGPHRPPCVVLPPPPPPPRGVYYIYPPAVYYYSYPPAYYSYEGIGGSFYYSTPRAGIRITW